MINRLLIGAAVAGATAAAAAGLAVGLSTGGGDATPSGARVVSGGVPFYACPGSDEVGKFSDGDRVYATGLDESGRWVRVRLPDHPLGTAWVQTASIEPDARLDLPVVDCTDVVIVDPAPSAGSGPDALAETAGSETSDDAPADIDAEEAGQADQTDDADEAGEADGTDRTDGADDADGVDAPTTTTTPTPETTTTTPDTTAPSDTTPTTTSPASTPTTTSPPTATTSTTSPPTTAAPTTAAPTTAAPTTTPPTTPPPTTTSPPTTAPPTTTTTPPTTPPPTTTTVPPSVSWGTPTRQHPVIRESFAGACDTSLPTSSQISVSASHPSGLSSVQFRYRLQGTWSSWTTAPLSGGQYRGTIGPFAPPLLPPDGSTEIAWELRATPNQGSTATLSSTANNAVTLVYCGLS